MRLHGACDPLAVATVWDGSRTRENILANRAEPWRSPAPGGVRGPGADVERVQDLAHTADIGFEVEAASLPRLFELAAEGLVEALGLENARGGVDRAPDRERIRLERPDVERLLVAWLRELLHRCTAERGVPEGTRVRLSGGTELDAEVAWGEWTTETAPVREIKGVTYHGLAVERRDDGTWHARVLLDV